MSEHDAQIVQLLKDNRWSRVEMAEKILQLRARVAELQEKLLDTTAFIVDEGYSDRFQLWLNGTLEDATSTGNNRE